MKRRGVFPLLYQFEFAEIARFLVLIIVSYLLSCNSKERDNIIYFTEEDLPHPTELVGEKYNIPEIVNPKGLMIKDELAVVFELKNVNDNKFHVIDLSSGTYLQSKGIDGLGPGEITVISQIEDAGEENKVWAYDPEIRKFSKYDLLDSNKLAEEEFRSPETSFFLTRLTWGKGQTLFGSAVDGLTKYLHLTKEGDTLHLMGDWKETVRHWELPNGYTPEDLDPNLISTMFQGPIKSNANGEMVVKVGTGVDHIDIIDLDGYKSKTIIGPSQEFQRFDIAYSRGYQMPDFGREKTTRYADVSLGENSFFALFRGKPFRELSSPENLNRIFEFDYEGNILNHYQLDFPVYGIAVDEENRAIYGVTVDREPNLVRFDY
ncbi:TolB-like 6-blade propeller-like [Algoriphagus locisalis]|uniref:TolB-like 6-blade propeller-like n=1 Tax=Algoriphagus locisalis TaxID=305507 RepID=A0A1I7A0E4_9BACT|nr:BF3164 family lipoprotein [Algoriphagus locisalis]SFT68418.1 TolB-like 6-blade propeller-like [Algoriphagus locisalis]